MEPKDKMDVVIWAKQLAIKYQKYESAANLRDMEKMIEKELMVGSTSTTTSSLMVQIKNIDMTIDDFSLDQLYYAEDILNKFFGKEVSELIPEIIQLRRNNNIDNLLK